MSRLWGALTNKDNPAQVIIRDEQGHDIGTTEHVAYYTDAYKKLEAVRNGVDRCVNGCASFTYDVKDRIIVGTTKMKQKKLLELLNVRPNPYQSVNKFWRNCFVDFFLDGNIFIYYDGVYLYQLPAQSVQIMTDEKTFVDHYMYAGRTKFLPEEIIHISDNSAESIYRGQSRLSAALQSIDTLKKMQDFQNKFFQHGTIPGLVITSKNPLGEKTKERLLASWTQRYSPTAGGRRPLILDGGLEVQNLIDKSFSELDFENSINKKEEAILLALGVPYILLRGGNNANISPNLRLFYLETIYPVVTMVASAVEGFFGFDIEPVVPNVSALQPEMKEASAYFTTLVNGGVMAPNEARSAMRLEPKAGHDDLRIPANIAGSAADPSSGGKPPTKTIGVTDEN